MFHCWFIGPGNIVQYPRTFECARHWGKGSHLATQPIQLKCKPCGNHAAKTSSVVIVTWSALLRQKPLNPHYSPLFLSTWSCVTNTLFVIRQLLKNSMPHGLRFLMATHPLCKVWSIHFGLHPVTVLCTQCVVAVALESAKTL